ncbi:MAG: hypothetical protein NT069_27085 [Planctomycetota bacterium]|nr:hypothetical protein [Planctomycetota bacterium]
MFKNRFAVRPLWLALLPLAFVTWSAVDGQIPMTKPRSDTPGAGAGVENVPVAPRDDSANLTPPIADVLARPEESGTGQVAPTGGAGSFVSPEAQQQSELQRLLRLYEEEGLEESERGKLRDDLKALLTQMFEQRQERRAAEIADIEKRLTKLKDLHKKRADLKESIIGNRLRQLLEDSEGLGWGDDTTASGTGESGSSFNPFSILSGFGSQGGMMSSGSGFFGPRGTTGGGMAPPTPRGGDTWSPETSRPRTTRPGQRRRVNPDVEYFEPAPEGKRQ